MVILWGTAADFHGSRILLCAAVVNSDMWLSRFTSVDDFVTELCFIAVGYILLRGYHDVGICSDGVQPLGKLLYDCLSGYFTGFLYHPAAGEANAEYYGVR